MNATISVQAQAPQARTPRRAGWRLPAGLLLLSAPPLAFGAFRLTQLATGASITPENARFFASPVPVVLHIVSAAVFAILGAFQFAAGFRRHWPGWHRVAGRLVVAAGLLAGCSGLWLALFYPRAHNVGDLLTAFRLLFGSAMVASIVLGLVTIRRGDVRRHRAWMTRAYAIGLGAGTQMFTGLVASLIVSPQTELSRALQDGAGWAINLAVAEWIIRRRLARSARNATRPTISAAVARPPSPSAPSSACLA
jgi:uncharacterized membrane protein